MSARINKKVLRVLNALVFSTSAFIAMPSQAVTPTVATFQISQLITLAGGDVLVGLVDGSNNKTGAECGTRGYFLIQKESRGAQNMFSHAMAAFMAGKTLAIFSDACSGGYAVANRFDN